MDNEVSIKFTGRVIKERFGVTIGQRDVLLTVKSYGYLVKLAMARTGLIEADDGWISKFTLEPYSYLNCARYIYRVKKELADQGIGLDLIENSRTGYYRINVDAGGIEFDRRRLRSFPDHLVSDAFCET